MDSLSQLFIDEEPPASASSQAGAGGHLPRLSGETPFRSPSTLPSRNAGAVPGRFTSNEWDASTGAWEPPGRLGECDLGFSLPVATLGLDGSIGAPAIPRLVYDARPNCPA